MSSWKKTGIPKKKNLRAWTCLARLTFHQNKRDPHGSLKIQGGPKNPDLSYLNTRLSRLDTPNLGSKTETQLDTKNDIP